MLFFKIFIILFLLKESLFASVFDVYGYSKKGMGDTGVASAFDYTASYYNPANLGFVTDKGVTFDFDFSFPRFVVSKNLTSKYSPVLPADNFEFGASLYTPVSSIFKKKLTICLNLYVPVKEKTQAGSYYYKIPQFPLYNRTSETLVALFGAGYRISSKLSVGMGLNIIGHLKGESNVTISINEQKILKKDVYMDIIPTVAFHGGITYQGDKFYLGFSYQQAISVDYDLKINVDVTEVGILIYHLTGSSLYLPHRFNFGFGYKFSNFFMAFDIRYYLYSLMPQIYSFLKINLDDRNLTDDEVNNLISIQPLKVPLLLKDIISLHFGVDYTVSPIVHLRFGLFYRPTPFPKQSGESNYLDSDALAVTSGLGIFVGKTSINCIVQYQHVFKREFSKIGSSEKFYFYGDTFFTGFSVIRKF